MWLIVQCCSLLQLGTALLQPGVQLIEAILQHLHAPFEPGLLGPRSFWFSNSANWSCWRSIMV